MASNRAAPDFRDPTRLQAVLNATFIGAQLLCVAWMAHLVMRDESGPEQQAYVFLVFGCLASVFYGLTRRPVTSFGVAALLLVAIQKLSVAKLEYLLAPMLIEDVTVVVRPEIGRLLLRGYPDLAWLFVGGLIALVCYAILAVMLERPRPVRRHWLPVGAIAGGVIGLAIVIPGPGPLAVVTAETTDPAQANSDWDLISRFFASAVHIGLERPSFAVPPAPWLAIGTAAAPVASAVRPDIVVVLEETTFNPQTVLPFCTPSICERPMLTGAPNSVAAGPMRVHVVGGLTWLSEFALLTGMPHSLFGQAGQYAPSKVLPRVKYTLPRRLKTLGYRTVVVYPVDKDAYGASVSYPIYGFDRVLTHPLVVRGERDGYWDLSDRELLDYVQRLIAAEDDRPDRAPLFVFVLTLQQHGPHAAGLRGQPTRDDRPTFPHVGRELNAKLNDYLTRLSWSDDAIRTFDAALRRRGRPYVLAHFGDHQPSFEGMLHGVPRRRQARRVPADYVTYFNIQAGGGLPQSGHRLETVYPMLDIALLGGLILDVARLPAGPYFAANIRLRQRCDGLFIDCADKDTLAAYQRYIFDELDAVAF